MDDNMSAVLAVLCIMLVVQFIVGLVQRSQHRATVARCNRLSTSLTESVATQRAMKVAARINRDHWRERASEFKSWWLAEREAREALERDLRQLVTPPRADDDYGPHDDPPTVGQADAARVVQMHAERRRDRGEPVTPERLISSDMEPIDVQDDSVPPVPRLTESVHDDDGEED